MKKLLLMAPLVLGACTSAPASTSMDTELPKFVGLPVSVAARKLGFPNHEKIIMNRKVYIWRTSLLIDSGRLHCEIRLIVDGSDIVQDYDFDGSVGACRYFDRLLSRN